jgi:hypothetical protein
MPHRLMGKKFVCTVGIQTLRWRYQNGCIQIWPKKVRGAASAAAAAAEPLLLLCCTSVHQKQWLQPRVL